MNNTREEIYNSCVNVGFFYIINHNIDIADLLEKTKKYFDRDIDYKMNFAINKYNKSNDNHYHGYFPYELNKTSLKEGLEISKYDHEWLTDIELKNGLLEYYDKIEKLGKYLMKMIAKGLNRDENFFEPYFTNGTSTLRILHYPVMKNSNGLSCSEHCDSGVLTILYQDDVGGLQIEHNNKWIDVPHIKNSFVINLGEALRVWSGNKILATKHRVKSVNRNRYSIPFFYEPDPNTNISNSDSEITYHDFLQEKIKNFSEY